MRCSTITMKIVEENVAIPDDRKCIKPFHTENNIELLWCSCYLLVRCAIAAFGIHYRNDDVSFSSWERPTKQ